MRRDGCGWFQVTSATTIGVGVDDEGLPQQMDDLGVQAPVLGRGALEQEGVQLLGRRGEKRVSSGMAP